MTHEDDVELVAQDLSHAFARLYSLRKVRECVPPDHIDKTPMRTTQAIFELFEGCDIDPAETLKTKFDNVKYNELIYVNDISFVSVCAHHTLPFFGKAYFGYVPNKSIVGISKIPRLVECLSRRPQIQEQLSQQIVDTFMQEVKPFGCGIVIEAWHLCMMIRGARQQSAYTKTTALRGSFELDPTRSEFLNGIRQSTERIWP